MAVAVRTGEVVASSSAWISGRDGQLDADGRWHGWWGAGYDVVDLAAGGTVVLSQRKLRTDDGRSPVPGGGSSIPTADGRLVCNERMFVHEIDQSDPTHLRCIYRAKGSEIISFGVAHERLYVLHLDGTLVVLGSRAASSRTDAGTE